MDEKNNSIIKDKEYPKSMDFQLLRKEAIASTQQMSGDKWTDYNIHDPGVTILEQFSFALTDIAYRTNINIETLLFHDSDREKIKESNLFYPAKDIFPTSAITLTDYRILILDKLPDKISNCWVNTITNHREGIQGLYDITILLKGDVNASEHAAIKLKIKQLFARNRNLCEDINEIAILEPEKIRFSADIDIYQDENAEDILTEILFDLENYLNPPVQFSSLEELENEGLGLDEIFDIPSYDHGFINRDQLKSKQQEYYVSKIADRILNVKGVRDVRNLKVSQDGIPVHGDTITVADDKFLTLGLLRSDVQDFPFKGFNILIYKGGVVNSYLQSAVIYSLEIKEAKTHRSYEIKTKIDKAIRDNVNTQDVTHYESIQKSFPGIYGVGDYTPSKEEGNLRKAQSEQLKAYLLFFDQIMANHLAQLSKIAELFSITDSNAEKERTYFTQLLTDKTPGASDLLKYKLPKQTDLLNRLSELKALLDVKKIKENEEYNRVLSDIKEKESAVKRLVSEAFDTLIKLPENKLKKSRHFKDRKIIMGLVDFQRLRKEQAKLSEDAGEALDVLNVQLSDKINELELLMTNELMEEVQYVDFEQKYLDNIMLQYDDSDDRKSRVLTHLLARFGESFTTDFHIKFSSLMEGESQANIYKKLISLKSIFLKEIVHLNRHRSVGVDYLSKNSSSTMIPLKRKVSLLLSLGEDNVQQLANTALKKEIKVAKLSSKDITFNTNKEGEKEYIQSSQSGDKITFLVNSSSYYTYLFKYGLSEINYRIVQESDKYVAYFAPPTGELPTRLFEQTSKDKAYAKIETLVLNLKKLNAKSEGFHIVEHILLRPMDSNECFFNIKGKASQSIFKSKVAQHEEIQLKVAHDTMLLACYSSNYKILQNPDKEFVVLIKDNIGTELAKSTSSFITEISAQAFVDDCVDFFKSNRESEEFDKLYELDNQKKYYFDLLDDKGEYLFRSTNALNISKQESTVQDISIYAVNPACYEIEKYKDNRYSVSLANYNEQVIAKSSGTFRSVKEADKFIENSLLYFEKIMDSGKYSSIVRFRRTDGRDANDFNSQISVVYSNWSSRFHNEEFLQLFKQTLFNCAPAHLAINTVGLNYTDMKEFEGLYFKYMKALPNQSIENQNSLKKLSNGLLDILIDKNALMVP